ncbi:hypothetical protein [uncultured Lamprocystis sp.]|uniref:hypothetical protein n=1 Tax=uncultured Lamprocystis sp. TaxID=543132 RepID=UPI0025E14562|nr:hypothetical protein [uncultured Lamprocystis sp.]
MVQRVGPERVSWLLRALHYLVQGHLVGLIGSARYLLGLERGRRHRAKVELSGGAAPEIPET